MKILFDILRRCYRKAVWALRASRLRFSQEPIENTVVFIFDNFHADGYALLPQAKLLSEKLNKDLIILGPVAKIDISVVAKFLYFVLREEKTWQNKLIEEIMRLSPHTELIFGSSNGTYSNLLYNAPFVTHEIQHGALGESYLPLKHDIFWSRCVTTKEFIENKKLHHDVRLLNNSLLTPKYGTKLVKTNDCNINFFSKVPGLRFSDKEVGQVEASLIKLFLEDKFNLAIFLHPRDKFIKFFLRNKLLVAKYYLKKNLYPLRQRKHNVVLSMYSTVLFEGVPDQYYLNLDIKSSGFVSNYIYSGVPKICRLEQLREKEQLVGCN